MARIALLFGTVAALAACGSDVPPRQPPSRAVTASAPLPQTEQRLISPKPPSAHTNRGLNGSLQHVDELLDYLERAQVGRR